MTSQFANPTLADRAWRSALRSYDALTGSPGPYCVVAFHRVWDQAQDELTYPPSAFTALCRYWRDHYEVINLDRLLARLASGDGAKDPVLAITFDDGYADNFETAAPILDQIGLSATFFLTTGAIGTRRCFAWDDALPVTPRLMDWDQVRQLHRAGFGIGSHTVTHARLSSLARGPLEYELTASRQHLEEELGEPVRDFAVPFGQPSDCSPTALARVEAAGYRCCLGCAGGLILPSDSAFALRRVSVSPRWHSTPKAWARFYARERLAGKRHRRALEAELSRAA